MVCYTFIMLAHEHGTRDMFNDCKIHSLKMKCSKQHAKHTKYVLLIIICIKINNRNFYVCQLEVNAVFQEYQSLLYIVSVQVYKIITDNSWVILWFTILFHFMISIVLVILSKAIKNWNNREIWDLNRYNSVLSYSFMELNAYIVLYCIVLYCIMRPYTDGPIGPLSYRHSSGDVRNPHSTLAKWGIFNLRSMSSQGTHLLIARRRNSINSVLVTISWMTCLIATREPRTINLSIAGERITFTM